MAIYKIAVMSDVHANFPALRSVLEDIENEKCEKIYHVGDAIGIGAFPRETLDLMLKEKIVMIMGNHEKYYLTSELKFPSDTNKGEVNHHQWVKRELGTQYEAIISEFPVMLKEEIRGVTVGFMHYVIVPGSNGQLHFKQVKKDLDEENIDAFFELDGYDIIFYGHQHHPLLDCHGAEKGIHYVNPSALGCQIGNFANYSILQVNEKEYSIVHKRVAYDKSIAIKALDERNVPAKEYIKKVFYGAK